MENSIRLAVEIVFTDTAHIPGEDQQKEIAENVLNALLRQVEEGNGLAPRDAEYVPEHIYINDYLTGGREIRFIHSF